MIAQLKKDQTLTQEELADLDIRQAAISKLEHQQDILIQTLRYVEALGGELEVRAKFPDREVILTHYTQKKRLEEVKVRQSSRGPT